MDKSRLMKRLIIELTNRCNAKCPFCVNRLFKKFGDMPDEIFNKVLEEAKEFELDSICVNNIGEPFLYKDLMDKIKKIRETFPKIKIVMFSNGSFLTLKILKQLKELNIYFSISLNCSNAEGRKKTMGLNDFDKVKKMIDKGIKMGVIKTVTFVDTSSLMPHPATGKFQSNEKEIKEFIKLFPNNSQIIPYANFAGCLFDTFNPKCGCGRARKELAVLFDGTVTLCCMTSLNVNFGNIRDKTLKEIWNSKERQDYKIAAEKGEWFGVCSNCTGA